GQQQAVAGSRLGLAEHASGRPALGVDLDSGQAVGAAEHVVVGVLDARLANLVTGDEALVAGLLELRPSDLANVPEDLRGEGAARVVAHVDALHGDPRVAGLVLA